MAGYRIPLHYRRLHGGDLSDRHENGRDLGQKRHWIVGRAVGWCADNRHGVPPPVQCRRWCRLAFYPGGDKRFGAWFGRADQFRHAWPGTRYAFAFRTRRHAQGVEQQSASSGEFRLFRPYVGALRHVGLDWPVSQRQLSDTPGDGRRRGQAARPSGQLRGYRRRRRRLPVGRPVRRSASGARP